MPKDEYGTYKEDAGSPHPLDPEEENYIPCNAVLRHTWDRYGERRYCAGLAIENFSSEGVETDYEHDGFCKHHQSRAELMEHRKEQMKTGAYAKSHESVFQHLEPHKQLLANDLFRSLLEESKYSNEWDIEETEMILDVSTADFMPDADSLAIEHPVPQEKRVRAQALWFASLDFMMMQDIRTEQFRVSAEEEYEGRDLAVGERTTYVASDDEVKEVVEEHHLNLPLSRIQKDYERHLSFGGVETEENQDTADVGQREWVLEVAPDEPEPEPEAKSTESSELSTLDVPDED